MNDTNQPNVSSNSFDSSNIFDLLGLNTLSEDEKNSILMTLVKAAVQRATDELLLSDRLTQQQKEEFERIVDTEKDSVALQEKLVALYPDLPLMVNEQANKLKMEMCFAQMNDLVPSLAGKVDDTKMQNLKGFVDEAKMYKERNDRNGFFEVFLKYKEFKSSL